MKPILEIQGISKKFRIQHLAGGYISLRERLVNVLKFEKTLTEDFWALKDVSFNVGPGESIGIIGRNGAGKSTLLKILSKITPPTSGSITARGRIASLLEVGTGFHPELTGRENIFFNGSLLGMKRKEIEAKFDEIVDFSGVEKFLDTPLKHFSSGMQLRLAFGVAAFLEPEILIIDEVLAVGDASFQRKCFEKMDNVNKSGRTLLFVSHNMAQVKALCRTGLFLEKGQVAYQGAMKDAISAYLSGTNNGFYIDVDSLPRAGVQNSDLRIKRLKIKNLMNGNAIHEGDEVEFEIGFQVNTPIHELVMGFSFTDFYSNNMIEGRSTSTLPSKSLDVGTYTAYVKFPIPLAANTYNLNLGARSEKGHIEFIPSVSSIEIMPAASQFEEWNKPSAGLVISPSAWEIQASQLD
jgi:ABC-type polysaccharide/polyol phosphate transport system ATPase subunit